MSLSANDKPPPFKLPALKEVLKIVSEYDVAKIIKETRRAAKLRNLSGIDMDRYLKCKLVYIIIRIKAETHPEKSDQDLTISVDAVFQRLGLQCPIQERQVAFYREHNAWTNDLYYGDECVLH